MRSKRNFGICGVSGEGYMRRLPQSPLPTAIGKLWAATILGVLAVIALIYGGKLLFTTAFVPWGAIGLGLLVLAALIALCAISAGRQSRELFRQAMPEMRPVPQHVPGRDYDHDWSYTKGE